MRGSRLRGSRRRCGRCWSRAAARRRALPSVTAGLSWSPAGRGAAWPAPRCGSSCRARQAIAGTGARYGRRSGGGRGALGKSCTFTGGVTSTWSAARCACVARGCCRASWHWPPSGIALHLRRGARRVLRVEHARDLRAAEGGRHHAAHQREGELLRGRDWRCPRPISCWRAVSSTCAIWTGASRRGGREGDDLGEAVGQHA